MKILITGVAGHLGFPTARALRAAGHIVYGLVRKQHQAIQISKEEIFPIIGDLTDFKSAGSTSSTPLLKVVEEVHVVIDFVSDMSTPNDPNTANRALRAALCQASKASGHKKRYIYVSGGLVYGNQPGKVCDETTHPKESDWRLGYEKETLAQTEIEGIVVRPAWIYGFQGNPIINTWWNYSANGDIEISGNLNKIYSWVHVLDIADAFVRLAEGPKYLAGEIFNVADDDRSTVGQIREAMARAAGAKGKVVNVPVGTDNFSQLLDSHLVLSNEKLKRMTGWRPRCGPLIDNIPLYYMACQAHKSSKEAAVGDKK